MRKINLCVIIISMASTTLMRASTTIAEIKMPTSDDNKKYEKKN